MTSYPESTKIDLLLPILGADGQPFTEVCTAKYVLSDVDGKELLKSEIKSAQNEVTISIGEEFNVVPVGQIKDARSLVVTFIKSDDSVISESKQFYLIESKTPLVVGVNSFVSLEKFRLIASTTPKMTYFAKATDDEIVVALAESCSKLKRYRYNLGRSTAMNNVSYVSEVAHKPMSIMDYCHLHSQGDILKDLTPEFYKLLPEDFRTALEKAQVIEANHILSPTDDIAERRQKGVILETINEVKMMFSNVAPIKSNTSTEALAVLSPWLIRNVRLARG